MSYLTEHPSPDGKYRILLAALEMRMSHWVESAALWCKGDSIALLEIGDDMWSVDSVKWSVDSSHVTLEMRRYPGDTPGITVTVFPEKSVATVQTPNGSETVSFSALSSQLEDYYRKAHKR